VLAALFEEQQAAAEYQQALYFELVLAGDDEQRIGSANAVEQPLPQHHAPLAAPAGLDLGGGIVFELDDLHHRLPPLPQHGDLPPHHELGRILRGEVDGGQERRFDLQQPRLALRPLRSDYPASNLGLHLCGVFEVALNPSKTHTSTDRSRRTCIDTAWELRRSFAWKGEKI